MSKLAGTDGCPSGWICVIREGGNIDSRLVATADQLVALATTLDVLAVDIPIGLTEAGRRSCDDLARKVLGWPRRNSVFPAPVRPALRATTRKEASEITARVDGRRVGMQAWAIYGKIRDMDRALCRNPGAQRIVREVHPEVSLWAWNGGRSMRAGKKTAQGRKERRRLVDDYFGPTAYDTVREKYLVKHVGRDDIVDAFAALWTAERIARGQATTLPSNPPLDSVGLRMEIVY